MIRWGILGTGNIARQFARGLRSAPDAQLIAVGSRSQASADKFGDEFNVLHRHPTYEALANDPDVDAIYVGTPHPFHCENTLLCLDAGKAVLCEKPFALNAREAQTMIDRAREKRLFLMEAMWTRFLPVLVRVRELLAAGAIGEPRMLTADFGFRADFDPQQRLFNPLLGGGALLDVGIYPVALASMIFGSPDSITARAHLGETGVDEQTALIFGYKGGQLALLSCAVRLDTPQEAIIMGTEGSIRIASPWWVPRSFSIVKPDKAVEVVNLPFEGNGYNYEANEVARCINAGLLESPVMPLDESLALMRTLDAARAQMGLVYPMETETPAAD